MRRLTCTSLLAIFTILLGAGSRQSRCEEGGTGHAKTIRDLFWVWATPERATPGDHTLATFAEASAPQRAALLGTPNVLMAGRGIPNDRQLAKAETESVKHASRLVWEIMPDGDEEYRNKFDYKQRVAQIAELQTDYPNIEAVLLDDMTSVAVDKGFKPEHIHAVKKLLAAGRKPLDVWGVFYTMNFHRPNINAYIEPLDVINLWTWHAKDVADLEKNVAYCEKHFPGKPIMLGLYLYDYGGGRPMPRDLMELQAATALKLAHEGRIAGIVLLTINNDEATLKWTADWIQRVGDQKLGTSQAAHDAKLLRNNLWAWGNPERATEGSHTTASFAQAGPAERAQLLGVENIFLAGAGVPLDYEEAARITQEAAGAKRLVWEILPDDAQNDDYAAQSAFDYSRRLAVVDQLSAQYPQIEGVLLDDMSTSAVNKGLKPEHLRRLRQALAQQGRADMKLWGVLYTMNLNDAHLPALVAHLDVILLAEWSGGKLTDLESNVRRVKQMFPDKPIVLATYMYDYGANRRMPRESLDHQYALALKLAREGVIEGVEFTTIDNDQEAVERTAQWIHGVGQSRIGER